MTTQEAQQYHVEQITTLFDTIADMVTAITMNYSEEAIGITMAAKKLQMPIVISFTLETNGYLPNGQSLKETIEQTDHATGFYPVYYMLNCAHPSHFIYVLTPGEVWLQRLGGLRANASVKSHVELNDSSELDIGHPEDLDLQYSHLTNLLPHFNVMCGCCGTDLRHV